MMVTAFMIKIATFDLIPTEAIYEEFFYFPEIDPFSLSFETVGIESTLFLQNIGFIMVMILVHVLIMIMHALMHGPRNCCPCSQKVHKKLGTYLYYNGLQRFYMEIYMDLALLSILNLHMADWETEFIAEKISNYLSGFVFFLVCLFPPIFLVFFCFNKPRFNSKRFQKKSGAVLEGMNLSRRNK